MLKPVGTVMAVALPSAALYLLVAGSVDLGEALGGIAALVLTGIYAATLHRAETRDVTLRWPAIAALARGYAAVFPSLWQVGRALLQPGDGQVSSQPFRHGSDGSQDAGRRAAAVLAISIAPNGYVLDETEDALLLHQFPPQPPRPDHEWPV